MKLTISGYLIAALLVALGFAALANGWTIVTRVGPIDNKAVVALIQTGVALLSAIAVAVLTGMLNRSAIRLQDDINKSAIKLKADLDQETSAVIAELNTKLNQSTEFLRSKLTNAGDEFRARLGEIVPRRHGAYHTMWAAATQYYYVLQSLEPGQFATAEVMGAAEKKCQEAYGESLLADPVDVDAFLRFWQEANVVREKAEKRRDTADGAWSVWKSEGAAFGQKYIALRDRFRTRLFSLPGSREESQPIQQETGPAPMGNGSA